MLKLLLCCTVLFIIVQGEFEIILPEIKQECLIEIAITPDEIKLINEHKPVESRNAKCFMACLGSKQFKFMAHGKYDHNQTLQKVQELTKGDSKKSAILLEILQACESSIKSSDICDAANEYFTCISKVIASREG